VSWAWEHPYLTFAIVIFALATVESFAEARAARKKGKKP
jgi:hypothetical protein